MSDYLERCEIAADEQGIPALVTAINASGQHATAAQTGGFTMAAYVEFSDDRYIYANPYGAAIYDENGYSADIVQFNEPQPTAVIAAAVSGYIKLIDTKLESNGE